MPANPGLQRENTKAAGAAPKNKGERWTYMVQAVAELALQRRDELIKSIGDVPFKSSGNVDRDEIRQRWQLLRKDPATLMDTLASYVKFSKDGRALFPKELIASISQAEKQVRAGNFD